MPSLDRLLEPLRHSPRLPEAMLVLQRELEEERSRRERFYREMTTEQKVEFIDGQVIFHSPARYRHLDVTGHTLTLVRTYVSIHRLGTVVSEKCLCVFPRNDYEPDIVFFGCVKAAALTPEMLRFPIPDMIVEVLSDSTETRDRGVKFEDYAAGGVGEYWLIDADQSTIEQYILRSGEYILQSKSSTGRLISTAIAGLELDIESLFDSNKNVAQLRRILL